MSAAAAAALRESRAKKKKLKGTTAVPRDFLAGVTALNLASASLDGAAAAVLVDGLRRNRSITTVNLCGAQLLPLPLTAGAADGAAAADATTSGASIGPGTAASGNVAGLVAGFAARNELLRFERQGVTENVRSLNSRGLGDAGAAVVAEFLRLRPAGDIAVESQRPAAPPHGGVGALAGASAGDRNSTVATIDTGAEPPGLRPGGRYIGHVDDAQAPVAVPSSKSSSSPPLPPPPLSPSWTPLIHLGLAKNGIGEPGMAALLRALLCGGPRVRQLQRLEVYCNAPSPRWGNFAGELLRCHPCLVAIDVGSNGLGDAGAGLLADALATGECARVREVHLDYSGIGAAGAERLLVAVPRCPTLARVWLHGNDGVPAATSRALAKLLSANSALFLRGGLSEAEYHQSVARQLAFRAKLLSTTAAASGGGDRGESPATPAPPRVPAVGCSAADSTGARPLPSADAVAQLAIEGFMRRSPPGYGGVAGGGGGKTVVAAFVEEDPAGALRLVALGSGTRFMNAAVVAAEAGAADTHADNGESGTGCRHHQRGDRSMASSVVKDSHAEMLARRALVRYLHAQVFAQQQQAVQGVAGGGGCRSSGGGGGGDGAAASEGAPHTPLVRQEGHRPGGSPAYALGAGYRLHFYTSTAPCGAASAVRGQIDAHQLCAKAASGGGGAGGTLEAWTPGHRKSCTDKLRRWLREGCQGKHLVPMLGRVPVATITVGLKFSRQCVDALVVRRLPAPPPPPPPRLERSSGDRGETAAATAVVPPARPAVVRGTSVRLEAFSTPAAAAPGLAAAAAAARSTPGAAASDKTTMAAVAALQGKSGNSDACFVWSAGDGPDARLHVHDGRTGLALDGRLSCCAPRVLQLEREVLQERAAASAGVSAAASAAAAAVAQ